MYLLYSAHKFTNFWLKSDTGVIFFAHSQKNEQSVRPQEADDVFALCCYSGYMLRRIDALLCAKKSFAIETTLATRSYGKLVKRAKGMGYEVFLLFFWLPSPDVAIERVSARVAAGGHNIPTDVIVRRYWLGLQNLFNIFAPIVDNWSLYDNSSDVSAIVENSVVVDSKKLKIIEELCRRRKK